MLFTLTFYARMGRGKKKKNSKGVFDVWSEHNFPRRGKHIPGMFRNENVMGGRCERRNGVCRRDIKSSLPLGPAERRR